MALRLVVKTFMAMKLVGVDDSRTDEWVDLAMALWVLLEVLSDVFPPDSAERSPGRTKGSGT